MIKKSFRSILQGKTSHKFVDMSENPIMSIYYTNRMVLFFMCAGNETFYATLYLMYFSEGPIGKFAALKCLNPHDMHGVLKLFMF